MKQKDLEKEVKELKKEQVELLTGEENMVLKSKYQALQEERDKLEEQLEDEQFKLRYQLDFRNMGKRPDAYLTEICELKKRNAQLTRSRNEKIAKINALITQRKTLQEEHKYDLKTWNGKVNQLEQGKSIYQKRLKYSKVESDLLRAELDQAQSKIKFQEAQLKVADDFK